MTQPGGTKMAISQLLLAIGPGWHFHINLYGTCRFSGYHFSAKSPERGMKIDQKFRNGL